MVADTAKHVLVDSLYLLALINPVSKISILAAFPPDEERGVFGRVIGESSLAAAGILLVAMAAGDFILRTIFHVDLYSLRVAGGSVLFWIGFNALRKGVFYERDTHEHFADIAVVPLACPMIAGPGTITACLGLTSQNGLARAVAPMLLALGINTILMFFARPISVALDRWNILGAVIRFTGLIVMTIGTQMVLDGLRQWWGA